MLRSPTIEPSLRTRLDGSFFGAGRGNPYDRALVSGEGRLVLHGSPAGRRTVCVSRFSEPADSADWRVLDRTRGPLLDVGCGPGRMVQAALERGIDVLGIDVSVAAVHLASSRGLPVILQSVFQPLPRDQGWASILVLDGNIGIGGDPRTLLARCVDLLEPAGEVIVEVTRNPRENHQFVGVLVDEIGRRSEPFPWAEVGQETLVRHAEHVGLLSVDHWTDSGRTFVTLRAAA